MANKPLISILQQNRYMRTLAEVSAFEAALGGLANSPDPDDLPELFLVFTDACEQHEAMWGLVHFVESFGMERQLQALIQTLPSMIVDASEWAEIFHCRILNDEKYRKYYKSLVSSQQKANRRAVEHVLNKIGGEDADFAPLVDYLLSK